MIRGDPAFREDFKQQLPARPSHRAGEQPPSPGTRGLFGGVGTASPRSRHRARRLPLCQQGLGGTGVRMQTRLKAPRRGATGQRVPARGRDGADVVTNSSPRT